MIPNKSFNQPSVLSFTHFTEFLGSRKKKSRILVIYMKFVLLMTQTLAIFIGLLSFFPSIPPFMGRLVSVAFPSLWNLDIPGFRYFAMSLRLTYSCFAAFDFLSLINVSWYIMNVEVSFTLLTFRTYLIALQAKTVELGASIVSQRLRCIQILCNRFNVIYASRFFVQFLSPSILAIIVSGTITLCLRPLIPFPLTLLLLAATFSKYITVIFVITLASTVWTESGQVIRQLRSTNKKAAMTKLNVRIIRSLHPIKIKMGSVNFIERMTPIIVLSFIVEQTVSVLLISL
jgi:hypothetical protein